MYPEVDLTMYFIASVAVQYLNCIPLVRMPQGAVARMYLWVSWLFKMAVVQSLLQNAGFSLVKP